MSIANIIGSEAGIALLGALFGAIWTLFKSSEWFGRLRNKRAERAVQVLEAAVEDTYRSYVQAIKEARADGQLTDEEKRRARQIAKERAQAIAQQQGVDLIRELGGDFIDLWLTRLVNKLKRG